jgi:PPOX class probable F420-dependent enzyme
LQLAIANLPLQSNSAFPICPGATAGTGLINHLVHPVLENSMHESLKQARYMNLATFRRNGAQVNTPVWFAEKNDRFYVFSAKDTGKVKRLRNSSQARVAPCDVRGTLTGDWLDAKCEFVDAEEEQPAYALLVDKYGWQMHITNFFSRLTGKIKHRIVLVVTVNTPGQL